jgi:hypothetical protein
LGLGEDNVPEWAGLALDKHSRLAVTDDDPVLQPSTLSSRRVPFFHVLLVLLRHLVKMIYLERPHDVLG